MLCTEELIQKVWEKGTIVSTNNPEFWRQDRCGAWMARYEYGRQRSLYGWEIDYINPQSQEGGQKLPNLRPVQWQNIHKQGRKLVCIVKAVGVENCTV